MIQSSVILLFQLYWVILILSFYMITSLLFYSIITIMNITSSSPPQQNRLALNAYNMKSFSLLPSSTSRSCLLSRTSIFFKKLDLSSLSSLSNEVQLDLYRNYSLKFIVINFSLSVYLSYTLISLESINDLLTILPSNIRNILSSKYPTSSSRKLTTIGWILRQVSVGGYLCITPHTNAIASSRTQRWGNTINGAIDFM